MSNVQDARRRLVLNNVVQGTATNDQARQLVLANRPRNWRNFFGRLLILGLISATAWAAYSYVQETPLNTYDYTARVERVLKKTPLIDGHNDLPYLLRLDLQNKIYDTSVFTFRERKKPNY